MVFDTKDGHVIAEWATEPTAKLAVLDGIVAVGTRDAEQGSVWGHDLRSGDERWRYEAPSDDDGAAASSVPRRLLDPRRCGQHGEHLRRRDDHRAHLDGVGGPGGHRALPRWSRVRIDPVTGALSLSTGGDGPPTTTLIALDADSADDVVVPGELVHVDVDDSSLPGTVLTTKAGTHAWDRTTGAELWEADVRPDGGALVLRGWVYLTTSTDVVALDGRTGETVWSTPVPAFAAGGLTTDGRHLLLLSSGMTATGSGSGGVTVLYLATGQKIRQLPYPEGVSNLQQMSGLLVGWADDTEEVVVLE